MKKIASEKWILWAVVLLIFALPGCKKDLESLPPDNTGDIKDVKVSPSFDWKTTKDLTLNVTGLPVPVTIKNTILITSADRVSTYFTDQLEMNRNYTINFSVPSYMTQVTVSYGTISKTIDIIGNTLNFDYILQ